MSMPLRRTVSPPESDNDAAVLIPKQRPHHCPHNFLTRYMLDSSWIMRFGGAKPEPIQSDCDVMIHEKAHSLPLAKVPSGLGCGKISAHLNR